MNRIKKLKILFFIIVAAILMALPFVIKKAKQTKPTTVTPIPTPVIPSFYRTTLPITLDLDEKNVNLPQELPLISLIPSSISEEEAKQTAKNLGFSSEAKKIKSSLYGDRLFWNDKLSYLYISLEIGNVSYGHNDMPITKSVGLKDEDINKTAEDFLNNNFPYASASYKVSSIQFIKKPDTQGTDLIETDKSKASFYKVNLVPKNLNLEMITFSQKSSPYGIVVLPDGKILSVTLDKIGEIKESASKYSIKNYNDIKSEAKNASLVDIEGIFSPQEQLPASSIESIKINKVSVVYVFENNTSKNLIPVFLFEGVLTKNDKNQLQVRLFLPAIKS